jgi:tetratricopeptide (TPR) repeat protein
MLVARLATAIALVASALLVPTARAQDGEMDPALTEPPDDQGDDDVEARALQLFEESVSLYQQGRFADAVVLLRRAYAMHEEPVLLYNLARALEGEGNYEDAVDAYGRYLETAGEIPDRGAIERKIDTLRESLERQHAAGAERRAALRETQPRSGRGPSPLPWIVAGLGAAGVGAGAVLGLLAQSAHDDAVEATSQAMTRQEQDRAEGLALGANIAFVVGGLLLAGGLVWAVLDLGGGSDEEEAVRLTLGPGGAALGGSF